jgi:heme exporter protein D
MNWANPAEFFAMGGYAFYVWGSFSVFALAIAVEIFMVIRRRYSVLRQLRYEQSRNP